MDAKLLAVSACLALWPAAAVAGEEGSCVGRAMASPDGTPSDLSDCELLRVIERAGLRRQLGPCVEKARRDLLRVFGGFAFDFELHPGGGISRLRIQHSAFEHTRLPACLEQALGRRLGGLGRGKPALMEGRFFLREKPPGGFSLSLSGRIASGKLLPPMPGLLQDNGEGLVSTCPLGTARLALRFDPIELNIGKKQVASPEPGLRPLVEACEEKLQAGNHSGWNGASWKREREKAGKCLVGLLEHADPQVRAMVAGKLALGGYRQGRRALTSVIDRMMQPADCTQGNCPLVAPAGIKEGLVLVRLVKAHLRLRRWVKEDVLAAMARHPSRRIRLKLIREIFAPWRGPLPSAAQILMVDPDPIVRASACNLGCQHEDRASREVFLKDLENPAPEIRAAVVLYARSCARKVGRRVVTSVRRETDPAVAVLMLLALPDAPRSVVTDWVKQTLFHPCPVVRFLAGELLPSTGNSLDQVVQEALEREPNQPLRDRLADLLDREGTVPPSRHRFQLWLQLSQ